MEKVWPYLSQSMQFRSSLMHDAMFKYPWEDDDYEFDFNSYYPPIPDELACLRKLLDSMRKNNCLLRPPTFPLQEDIRNCPFCHVDRYLLRSRLRDILAKDLILADVDILNHPVWDMDPIPCPSHLFKHVWPEPEGGAPVLVTPEELDDTKKYLNQVRNSRGYDVDCSPHPNLVYQAFWKSDIDENSKTGKNYKLKEILKIVATDRRMTLLTFTAKVVENDDSASAAASETFIATLNEHNNGTNSIMECLLKPDGDAPGPYQYPGFEIQPITIPDAMKAYISPNVYPGPQIMGHFLPLARTLFHLFSFLAASHVPCWPPMLCSTSKSWGRSSKSWLALTGLRRCPRACSIPKTKHILNWLPTSLKSRSKRLRSKRGWRPARL